MQWQSSTVLSLPFFRFIVLFLAFSLSWSVLVVVCTCTVGWLVLLVLVRTLVRTLKLNRGKSFDRWWEKVSFFICHTAKARQGRRERPVGNRNVFKRRRRETWTWTMSSSDSWMTRPNVVMWLHLIGHQDTYWRWLCEYTWKVSHCDCRERGGLILGEKWVQVGYYSLLAGVWMEFSFFVSLYTWKIPTKNTNCTCTRDTYESARVFVCVWKSITPSSRAHPACLDLLILRAILFYVTIYFTGGSLSIYCSPICYSYSILYAFFPMNEWLVAGLRC